MRFITIMAYTGGISLLILSGVLTLARQKEALSAWIAFVSNDDGVFELYTMRSDGSELTRLTFGGVNVSAPTWSPDGQQIAYSSSSINTDLALFVIPARGGQARQITFWPGDEVMPAWSPDGEWLAFALQGIYYEGIYVLPLAQPQDATLITTALSPFNPTWSPDGEWIAYSSLSSSNFYNISRARRNGSSRQTLTDSNEDNFSPSYSPDEAWIVFSGYAEDNGERELFVMRPDGSDAHKLTDSPQNERDPAWSPDGAWIAFSRPDAISIDIYRMHPDGSQITRLTDLTAYEIKPTWSPVIDLPLHSAYLLLAAFGLLAVGVGESRTRPYNREK